MRVLSLQVLGAVLLVVSIRFDLALLSLLGAVLVMTWPVTVWLVLRRLADGPRGRRNWN